MENWLNPGLIFSGATVAVALRDSSDTDVLLEKSIIYQEKFNAKTVLLNPKRFDYSSSEIRKRVSDGLCIDFFVPKAVSDYIKNERLYTE